MKLRLTFQLVTPVTPQPLRAVWELFHQWRPNGWAGSRVGRRLEKHFWAVSEKL